MNQDKQVNILLVDDKPANILVLQVLLEKANRLFFKATDGNEALKIALTEDIDLIILDVQMPGMDGFEVAKILKSNKKTKDIPIIFATAEKKEHQSMVKGFEEGAVDYLFKPLDADVTKAKVAVLLKIQLQKKELIEKNISLEKADEQIKKLNSDLQQNVAQLELVNKELESFSYSVSHDLRAPLRGLNGYAKILEEDYAGTLDEEAKRLLGNIHRNVKRMEELIDNLLEFSRLGRKELQTVEVSMTELVNKCIEEINSTTKHSAQIQVNDLPPVNGDGALLTQVWFNLISNAVKYSGKKEHPRVEIGSSREEDRIIYYVKDNGAGFDMKYSEKLFGVFQRLHTNTEFEGTGIGLAIVLRIITKHGGKVWADAKPNEGATFYFALPG